MSEASVNSKKFDETQAYAVFRVQALTSSISLIARPTNDTHDFQGKTLRHLPSLSGGNSEEDTPVPIPNTEVKLFSAVGT